MAKEFIVAFLAEFKPHNVLHSFFVHNVFGEELDSVSLARSATCTRDRNTGHGGYFFGYKLVLVQKIKAEPVGTPNDYQYSELS